MSLFRWQSVMKPGERGKIMRGVGVVVGGVVVGEEVGGVVEGGEEEEDLVVEGGGIVTSVVLSDMKFIQRLSTVKNHIIIDNNCLSYNVP